jgi:hypothetical protein
MHLSRPASPVVVLLLSLVLHSASFAVPIRFLPWDESIAARKMGLQNATGVTEITNLHPDKRSKPLDGTSGEVPLRLVALDRTSPDGKPVTVDIKAPSGIQSPLVLILPDPKHPTGLRTFVIEDNTSNFRWGTIRLINATGKALLFRHEQAIASVPETWAPVDIDPGGKPRNMGVQFAARANLTEILYSAMWEYDPDVRKLIFVLPGTDASTGSVEFKIIPENRRIIAAEAAAARSEPTN